jgi:hypothetical protein
MAEAKYVDAGPAAAGGYSPMTGATIRRFIEEVKLRMR